MPLVGRLGREGLHCINNESLCNTCSHMYFCMLCPFRDYYAVLAPIAHLMGPDMEALCERRRPMILVRHHPFRLFCFFVQAARSRSGPKCCTQKWRIGGKYKLHVASAFNVQAESLSCIRQAVSGCFGCTGCRPSKTKTMEMSSLLLHAFVQAKANGLYCWFAFGFTAFS